MKRPPDRKLVLAALALLAAASSLVTRPDAGSAAREGAAMLVVPAPASQRGS